MELPSSLNRKTLKRVFFRLPDRTWEYLFDHEKENGLAECRIKGYGGKELWYSTDQVKSWLVARCYYLPEDFGKALEKPASRWVQLMVA